MSEDYEDLQLNNTENDANDEEGAGEEKTESKEEQPEISLIELGLWPLPAAVLSDVVDLVNWTGIGTFVSWAVGILSGGSLALWLFMKGLRGEFMILGTVVDMIPFVGMLPIKTVILLFIYFKQKHPEKLQLAGKALQVAGTATGQAELTIAGKALGAAAKNNQKNENE